MSHYNYINIFLILTLGMISASIYAANSANESSREVKKVSKGNVTSPKSSEKVPDKIPKNVNTKNARENDDTDDELIINANKHFFEYERNNKYYVIRRHFLYNRFDKIEKILRSFIEKYPAAKDKEYYYYWGVIHENRGEYITALESYQKAIDILPTYSRARNSLGSLYCKMHKYDMALDNFLLAEETNPYNPFIQYNIGSLFFKTGKLDKAIKYLKNSIKYKANFGSAFHKLANIMYKKKRFRAAINYYKKAIGFNTVSHTTYYFIGLSYLNIKNVSSAITSLNQSLKLKNNFFEAALEMGKIYHSYGEFQNAIKMYLWAESINAEHRNLRLWLSQCYSETGKYSSAIDIVKKLIEQEPNSDKLKKYLHSLEEKIEVENFNDPDDYYKY